jgi:hypothetical protein
MKCIATTTIYEPSEALRKYAAMSDWKLIVAGDRKTPHESYRKMENIIYLDPDEQERLYPRLSDAIGWNCMERRNISILHAYKLGAEVVALVDDDNIPLDGWGQNLMIGKPTKCTIYTPTKHPLVFDPVSATEYKNIWHRGYPMPWLNGRHEWTKEEGVVTPAIQADFWNGDPDIDAVCRCEHAPDCTFNPSNFPIATTALSPFNSQNTFLSRGVIRDYFLWPETLRMQDIWAAYYVEALGHKVVYGKASVYQARNEHNLVTDFKNEIIGYLNTHTLVTEPLNIKKYVSEKSWDAFVEYQREIDA